MYAISSKYESYKEVDNSFFTVEGDDRYADRICSVIETLGNRCVKISGKDKVKYHSAAVFASNLVTGLLATSQELLRQCGFSEEEAQMAIMPLFLGNAENAAAKGPADSLTGPVERCDIGTVKSTWRYFPAMNCRLTLRFLDALYRLHRKNIRTEIMRI